MEFEGYDWTELAVHFGILSKEENVQDDTESLNKTKEYLHSTLFDEEKQKEIVIPLRQFLDKLYNMSLRHSHEAPIWHGLLEITDNFTLIKYSIILLEYMWN